MCSPWPLVKHRGWQLLVTTWPACSLPALWGGRVHAQMRRMALQRRAAPQHPAGVGDGGHVDAQLLGDAPPALLGHRRIEAAMLLHADVIIDHLWCVCDSSPGSGRCGICNSMAA